MRFLRSSKVGADIPNSSMSDIAFLLLIFFMVTTAFAAQQGIDFRLPPPPRDREDIPEEELEAITIAVQASGRLVVDGMPKNLNDLGPYIRPVLAIKPEQFVIIQMDMDANYGHMMDVLDHLKIIGVQNIALPSRQDMRSW